MAGRENDVGLAPAEASARADYNRDFYSWLMEQAQLVRDGRWDELDRDNLAEEIESLGREQFDKLESALRVLMLHMLKWDHQPEKRTRSWALSIREQRIRVKNVIDDNPGLKPRIDEAMARAYLQARLAAARETGLAESRFPEPCPYEWNDLMARDISL
jgi:hypothetical protein